MKKLNFRKKLVWGLIGVGALIIPTVAITAVACSSGKPTSKIMIKTQPQSLNAFVGQTTNLPTFSVTVENLANAQFTYQWYSNTINSKTNAVKIAGATNSSYTLKAQDLTKPGTTYFYAEIIGTQNNVSLTATTSNIASLTIASAPLLSIQSQPTNQNATVNQTTNLPQFKVTINPIPNAELTYQWYESDTNSSTSGTLIPNATQPSYTISTNAVAKAGTKYYYVKINGSLNGVTLKTVTSNLATLTINDKPTISIGTQPVSQNVTVGETENLPSFSVAVNNIEGAQLTYQWYSNANNSTTGGTAIDGATSMTYTVKSSDIGNTATTKYYYVTVSGTLNGVALTPVTSSAVALNITARPANNIIANSLATAINTLNPNVANFAGTEELQYMAPSYAAQQKLPQIQTLVQDLIKKNPETFNNLSVSGAPIKINPDLVTITAETASPATGTDSTENVDKTLNLSISYGVSEEENSSPVAKNNSSNRITLAGFNGFSDEQKTKIATWFNQTATQEKLMKNLLDTTQGKTFLTNLLNQTFFKFVIKGLGANFELQSVTLNNNLNFTGITNPLSAFILKIKTTAAAQYSATVSNQSLPSDNFTSFQTLPANSIISFQLPLTFKLPPSTTQDIYQPSYVLSSTYENTTDANPSWVLMNNLAQFNPLISWSLPPYKQTGQGIGNYPEDAGSVGVLGVLSTGSYPRHSYTLSINNPDGTALVSSADLFFRFAEKTSRVAYANADSTLVTNGLSYIQMPVFTPNTDSAITVFNALFQEILTSVIN